MCVKRGKIVQQNIDGGSITTAATADDDDDNDEGKKMEKTEVCTRRYVEN